MYRLPVGYEVVRYKQDVYLLGKLVIPAGLWKQEVFGSPKAELLGVRVPVRFLLWLLK